MTKYNKSFLAFVLGLVTVVGAAGVANARSPHHGGGGHGYGYGAMQPPSPEAQKMMEAAYNNIAPLVMELRAKQAELTAKIYGGADDSTIDNLTKDVARLQAQVTEARVKMQRNFAKEGIPMHHTGGGCMFGGGGPGMRGWHGGMGPGAGYAPDTNN